VPSKGENRGNIRVRLPRFCPPGEIRDTQGNEMVTSGGSQGPGREEILQNVYEIASNLERRYFG